MSDGQEDTTHQPTLIIKRRRGGDGDGHHGGVWKIAYADFMTAMMAFFLVMWLVNSSDDKTIVQVAAYFNPLRLSDRASSQKGLHDGTSPARPQPGEVDATGESKKPAHSNAEALKPEKKESKKELRAKANREQRLFADPMETLADLASKSVGQEPDVGAGAEHVGDIRASGGGGALRDPYDPVIRTPEQRAAARIVEQELKESRAAAAIPAAKGDVRAATRDGSVQENPSQVPASAAPAGESSAKTSDSGSPSGAASDGKVENAAKAIESAINKVLATLEGPRPRIDVKVTPEGILISLTDDANFGMFAVASAEPRPELIAVTDRIGAILQQRKGGIIVRGHTDGRPYRTALYDNWRLSTARAHMAYYMLVRAGIPANRFERIEGYADRQLRVPEDKEAAQNRRIEILLRLDQ